MAEKQQPMGFPKGITFFICIMAIITIGLFICGRLLNEKEIEANKCVMNSLEDIYGTGYYEPEYCKVKKDVCTKDGNVGNLFACNAREGCLGIPVNYFDCDI